MGTGKLRTFRGICANRATAPCGPRSGSSNLGCAISRCCANRTRCDGSTSPLTRPPNLPGWRQGRRAMRALGEDAARAGAEARVALFHDAERAQGWRATRLAAAVGDEAGCSGPMTRLEIERAPREWDARRWCRSRRSEGLEPEPLQQRFDRSLSVTSVNDQVRLEVLGDPA